MYYTINQNGKTPGMNKYCGLFAGGGVLVVDAPVRFADGAQLSIKLLGRSPKY
jgi:hypothetical protein